MSGFTVKIDFSDRYKKIVGSKYSTFLDKSLTKSIVESETICIREAPVKTGTLRRSISHSHPSECEVCLTGVEYWKHVQYGTAPHVITPKHSKFLHWKDNKGEHFATKVHHPGTKANPFVTRTAKKIKSKKVVERNLYDVLKSEGIIE